MKWCGDCSSSLSGKSYVSVKNKEVCSDCFNKNYAENCSGCNRMIKAGEEMLVYKDQKFHKNCFECNFCNIPITSKSFHKVDNKFCCSECYNGKFSKVCYGCNIMILPGEVSLTYKNNNFHNNCFICVKCRNSIGTDKFYEREEGVVCQECQRFSTPRCKSCNQSLGNSSVNFKGMPYHVECFVCISCGVELSGNAFKNQNNNNYCISCYDKSFSKICDGCKKVISVGGSKSYVYFENYNWHNGCFNCHMCNMSLLDKGFKMIDNKPHCDRC